jgi:hypothetical protein
MHKLYEYVCDELKGLEKKAEKGSLSMQEIQYADTLAHLKKNLMKADEMMEDEYGEYSMAYYPMTSYAEDGGRTGRASYARRRDTHGRYSSRGYSMAGDGFRRELEGLAEDAPTEHVKQKLRDIIREM